MSDCYFMMFGSPGKAQVRGPHRSDHHAGWLEIMTFHWVEGHAGSGGAGKATFRELEFWMRASAASQQLWSYGMAGGAFDLVVLDIWDDGARRSKGKLELYDVLVAAYRSASDPEGPLGGFTLSFGGLRVSPGAGPQTAGISPAAVQAALARAARRPASAAPD